MEKYPPQKNPMVSVDINLDGTGTYKKSITSDRGTFEKTKQFRVNAKQLEYVYFQVMRANFFDIEEVLGSPDMKKGTIIKVTVKIDHHMHSVTMYGERYLAVDDIVNAVLKFMPDDLKKDYNRKNFNYSEIKLP
ncbi:MAG: hypothetical protein K8T10_04380 [Candidatus Eremiobacteraeota bacterium]|nr:hypothetical protein [Candidatus Eremiobacteraeota bacterium]